MENQFTKKNIWVIKNFSSLPSKCLFSDDYLAGGCKWKIVAYPKGRNDPDYLSLYLQVADHESLPSGWRRHAKVCFVLINQRSENLSKRNKEIQKWFEHEAPSWGHSSTFPLSEILAEDSGYLVNGELRVVVEIDVLEVIGKLDVSEETSTILETMEIHGFQLLPSQAKSVSRIFERHPEIASDFLSKNPNLMTGYMSLLLSVIETVCQLPQKISKGDLVDAYVAPRSMRDAGFKLDWLEKKFDEVSEKKENVEASETRLQEMEEELRDFKEKCSAMEDLVEKERVKVSIATAPISFDDVV